MTQNWSTTWQTPARHDSQGPQSADDRHVGSTGWSGTHWPSWQTSPARQCSGASQPRRQRPWRQEEPSEQSEWSWQIRSSTQRPSSQRWPAAQSVRSVQDFASSRSFEGGSSVGSPASSGIPASGLWSSPSVEPGSSGAGAGRVGSSGLAGTQTERQQRPPSH